MAPDMPVYTCPTLELPEGMHLSFDCPSTVILVKVPMYVAQTLQQRGTSNDLATLRACLVEHLAVAYRCYLEVNSATMEAQAKIAVSIGEDVVFVPAIQLPAIIEDKNRNHFQVEVDGQLVDIDYTFGQLDEEARNHLINGVRCRDHYQHNTRTQGIDIILNNRVIATSMFDEIWKNEQGEPLARHPSYNDFVGELTIHNAPPSAFPPVCNKTGIHPCDRNWCNLLGLLGQYPPPHDNRLCSEKDLQEALVRNIQATTDEHEILSEVSVWDSGTRMDIVEKWDSHFVIYELKIGSAAPINLYQLKMYWDGCLTQGVQPTKAVLVVKSYSPTLFAMAEAMNQMPAPPMPDGTPSLPYRFAIVTHEEKGLVAGNDENS